MRINRDWTEDWGGQTGPADHSPSPATPHHHTHNGEVDLPITPSHPQCNGVMDLPHHNRTPTTKTSWPGKNPIREEKIQKKFGLRKTGEKILVFTVQKPV